jgi:uncharacterized membrane protein
VFDQINGLPVHALVLHAAVVFIPLLAIGAIVYGVAPRLRAKIGWAVGALAVIAPICALVTKESGEKLYDRLAAQGMKPGAALISHMGYGDRTFVFALALGVVTLVTVILTRRRTLPRPADLGLAVVMVVLAAFSGYYVYKTGDSGATAVWGTTA